VIAKEGEDGLGGGYGNDEANSDLDKRLNR
jgi:hypothetical protein